MARDQESLKIEPWAESGSRTDPDDSSLSPALDRDIGWPSSFSQAGGNVPRRTVFNQIFREITGMLNEINQRGILEYDSGIDYLHPSYVVHTNGKLYRSKRANGPTSSNAGAPEAAGNGVANWQLAAENPSDASTTVKGIIEIATQAEANALTASDKAITPENIPDASATQKGIAEFATQTEVDALTSTDKMVSPGTLPVATATKKGIAERATDAEVKAGTDTERFITSAALKAILSAFKLVKTTYTSGSGTFSVGSSTLGVLIICAGGGGSGGQAYKYSGSAIDGNNGGTSTVTKSGTTICSAEGGMGGKGMLATSTSGSSAQTRAGNSGTGMIIVGGGAPGGCGRRYRTGTEDQDVVGETGFAGALSIVYDHTPPSSYAYSVGAGGATTGTGTYTGGAGANGSITFYQLQIDTT